MNANNYARTIVYDDANRQIAIIDTNAHATSYIYDAAGHRINEINAEGGIIRLVQRTNLGFNFLMGMAVLLIALWPT